uniref:LepA_C domain-containing protein n=1 Tax=Macrostomum lignano TaxID=282301 RepID=A0A1I8F8X1_9PLAT
PAHPMVFCGLFRAPCPQEDIDRLSRRRPLSKLTLNDASVSVAPDSNPALGRRWRLGFLGLLHIMDRLPAAPGVGVQTLNGHPYRAASIPYRVQLHLWQHYSEVAEHFEPLCRANNRSSTPAKYSGCCSSAHARAPRQHPQPVLHRLRSHPVGGPRCALSEIVIDLVDVLKTRSSGYASFHYEEAGWQSCQLVKLVPHLNDRPRAVVMATKLAEELPRQQFLIKVQIKAGNNKVVASSQIKPFRKDVVPEN